MYPLPAMDNNLNQIPKSLVSVSMRQTIEISSKLSPFPFSIDYNCDSQWNRFIRFVVNHIGGIMFDKTRNTLTN